jgi:hypothetical protein
VRSGDHATDRWRSNREIHHDILRDLVAIVVMLMLVILVEQQPRTPEVHDKAERGNQDCLIKT